MKHRSLRLAEGRELIAAAARPSCGSPGSVPAAGSGANGGCKRRLSSLTKPHTARRRLPRGRDCSGGSRCSSRSSTWPRAGGRRPVAQVRAGHLSSAALAEGVGFEPTVRRNARRFSRPLPSTTRAPLRGRILILNRASSTVQRPDCGRTDSRFDSNAVTNWLEGAPRRAP